MDWNTWKKSFDKWEDRTAKLLEVSLKSPLVLRPAAAALSASLRAKATADKVAAYVVGHLGLPTKADQERTLHAIYRLESRLIDLEEKLDEVPSHGATPRSAATTNASLEQHDAPRDERTLSAGGMTPHPLAELHGEKRK